MIFYKKPIIMSHAYGMCQSCNKCQYNIKFNFCYECRRNMKCHYCDNLNPYNIDFLGNYSCSECFNVKKCANCFNNMYNVYIKKNQNDYCSKCELSRGICPICKSSKILVCCGLCRNCEFTNKFKL